VCTSRGASSRRVCEWRNREMGARKLPTHISRHESSICFANIEEVSFSFKFLIVIYVPIFLL
jgi:hypothetical protein